MENIIEANEPVKLESRMIPFTMSQSSTLDIIEPIPFDQLPNILDICDENREVTDCKCSFRDTDQYEMPTEFELLNENEFISNERITHIFKIH